MLGEHKSLREGMLFLVHSMRHPWTLCLISFLLYFPPWWAEGLVMALTAVILNTFSYFTFHNFHLHSLYKIVSLFFLRGVHHCEKKWFQNSTHLLFWTYMYFCNVLKNQYKKANTSINVAIALWLKQLFPLIISSSPFTIANNASAAAPGTTAGPSVQLYCN